MRGTLRTRANVLLKRTGLGLLYHLLTGSDIDFDTAVHGTSLGSVIGCYIVLHRKALRRKTSGIYTAIDKVVAHSIGTLAREFLVYLEATCIVGKSIDLDIGAGVVVEIGGKSREVALGLGVERVFARGEEDAAVESNLDGLQSVLVGGLLYLGLIGQLFLKLLLLLIHLVADECACTCADSCTYGTTDAGALAAADERADAGAYGCTAATAYQCAFTCIGHRVTRCFTYEQCACNSRNA